MLAYFSLFWGSKLYHHLLCVEFLYYDHKMSNFYTNIWWFINFLKGFSVSLDISVLLAPIQLQHLSHITSIDIKSFILQKDFAAVLHVL